MKLKNIYRIAAVLLVTLTSGASANAQNLASAYFDSNYNYRFQINPAFGNDDKHGFVSMPALGNFVAEMQGNTGLDKFLYNIDGKTTTFLNPKVDATSFLNSLKDRTRIGASVRETVLAAGFKSWGGYNTVSIGVRGDVGFYIPKDLFRLAKQGAENRSYNIGDMGVQTTAWAEIALGHSRQINDKWRVGAAVKLLLGAGNIDAHFYNAELNLGVDTWTATVDAELRNSVANLNYTKGYNENTQREYVDGFDYDKFAIGGYGAAFDLGAVFTLNKDWEFSASVVDLGFISWKSNNLASTNGPQTVVTDNYTFDVDDMDAGFDKLRDDVTALYQLSDMGDQGGRTTMLGATANIGVQFKLPVYRRLKFGLLNSTRIQGTYSWTDFRLSANVMPVEMFSAGVNIGMGTFGFSWGWIVNLNTTGFNLFLASDVTPGKLAKQGVPVGSNASVNIGINFPF